MNDRSNQVGFGYRRAAIHAGEARVRRDPLTPFVERKTERALSKAGAEWRYPKYRMDDDVVVGFWMAAVFIALGVVLLGFDEDAGAALIALACIVLAICGLSESVLRARHASELRRCFVDAPPAGQALLEHYQCRFKRLREVLAEQGSGNSDHFVVEPRVLAYIRETEERVPALSSLVEAYAGAVDAEAVDRAFAAITEACTLLDRAHGALLGLHQAHDAATALPIWPEVDAYIRRIEEACAGLPGPTGVRVETVEDLGSDGISAGGSASVRARVAGV